MPEDYANITLWERSYHLVVLTHKGTCHRDKWQVQIYNVAGRVAAKRPLEGPIMLFGGSSPVAELCPRYILLCVWIVNLSLILVPVTCRRHVPWFVRTLGLKPSQPLQEGSSSVVKKWSSELHNKSFHFPV